MVSERGIRAAMREEQYIDGEIEQAVDRFHDESAPLCPQTIRPRQTAPSERNTEIPDASQ